MAGDWDTEHVYLKLRDGAKPYHGWPILTPKVKKKKKEVARLCEFGVLKSGLFIVPKQNQTVCFASDVSQRSSIFKTDSSNTRSTDFAKITDIICIQLT